VIFVALVKGLIAPLALASVLMQGSPAALLCAGGAASAAAEAAMDSSHAAHAGCACAAASDVFLADRLSVGGCQCVAHAPHWALAPTGAGYALGLLLPPANGPPAIAL
jgi:hypothetical protein